MLYILESYSCCSSDPKSGSSHFCLLERATSAAASSYVTPSLPTKEKEISAKIEHVLKAE